MQAHCHIETPTTGHVSAYPPIEGGYRSEPWGSIHLATGDGTVVLYVSRSQVRDVANTLTKLASELVTKVEGVTS